MRRHLACHLAIATIVVALEGRAQARGLAWHGPGPEGVDIQGIGVIVGINPALVAASSDQIFRSADDGLHWNTPASVPPDNRGFISPSVVVAPSNPDEVFILDFLGILRSLDAGLTWTNATTPPIGQVQSLALDPVNPAILYAGTIPISLPDLPNNGGGLFRSTDAGDSWTESSITESVSSVAIDPTDSNVLLIATNAKLLRSSDGGSTWTTLSVPSGYAFVVRFDETRPGRAFAFTASGLAISVDHGQSWILVGGVVGTTTAGNYLRAVSGVAGAPGVLIAGFQSFLSGHCYRSTDGGATWALSERGLVGDVAFNDLKINPDGGEIFAATDGAGVFESTDAGESWAPINAGLPGADGEALALAPSRSNTAYVGTRAGVFRTNDGGASWQSANTGLGLDVATALAVDPAIATTAFAETRSGIFNTTDGGISWTGIGPAPVWYGYGDNNDTALAINPSDSMTIFAAGPSCLSSLIVSHDGGTTWGPVLFNPDPSACAAVETIAFDPRFPGTIYVGSMQGIFKSTDGGESWISRNDFVGMSWSGGLDVRAFAFDPFNLQVVITIAGNGYVFRSEDGAMSWHFIPGLYFEEPVKAILFDPAVRGRMLLGLDRNGSNRHGIWESLNGGSTWNPFSPGSPGFSVNAMALSTDSTRFYTTGSGTMSLLPQPLGVSAIGSAAPGRIGGR